MQPTAQETPLTFAGFNYPKYQAGLPKGTPQQRITAKRADQYYKFAGVGAYFSPRPVPVHGDDGRSFYFESDFMPGLRWTYCDQVDGSGIRHTGWFDMPEGDGDKLRGVVFRLPHGRGFLPGWTMGEGMISEIEYDIYEDEAQAARAADSLAQRCAERAIDEYMAEKEREKEEEQGAEDEPEPEADESDKEEQMLDDFEGYCRNVTDSQVLGIIEKEREAAKSGDAFRKACLRIARAEARARGIE